MTHDRYQNPLCARYAGREMQEIFSDDRKFSTWRRLWLALAESEKELGIPGEAVYVSYFGTSNWGWNGSNF